MFEKIKWFFTPSSEAVPKENVEEEENSQKKIVELPDTLEVLWSDMIHLKNIDLARKKLHVKIKELLYKAKMTEIKAFQTLDIYRDIEKEKLEELHEKYKVPADGSYDLELPEVTGKVGYFKKRGK